MIEVSRFEMSGDCLKAESKGVQILRQAYCFNLSNIIKYNNSINKTVLIISALQFYRLILMIFYIEDIKYNY